MQIREIKSQFNRGHVALIAAALLIVGGLTAIQSRDAVARLFSNVTRSDAPEGSGLYYAYVPEPLPDVLGEDTLPDGPSVVNEDGTISALDDFGDVLGVNSESPVIDLNSVSVSFNEMSLRDYLNKTFLIEAAIKPGDFESALVSTDQAQNQEQIRLLVAVQKQLQDMSIPRPAEKLHKYKILQYTTAIDLLTNYFQSDSNPEYVASTLTQFMEMQKQQDAEMQTLFKNNPEL